MCLYMTSVDDSANTIKALLKGAKIRKIYNPDTILETVNLTEDNTIVKHITQFANTDSDTTPQNNQLVIAHYTGYLLDGSKFDSSVDRNEPFQFQLGVKQVIPLWDIGFASMKKGEKAILIGDYEHCYGEQGRPPQIPPKSTLVFIVELLDFMDKPKEIFEMTPEEKVECMLKYKGEAKELFETNNISGAYDMFKKSLDHLCDEQHEERINLLINLSICCAKLNNWQLSLQYSETAIKLDESNIKALYRSALADYRLKYYLRSIDKCKFIINKSPDNNMVKALLRNAFNEHKAELQKEKNMCKRMF